MPPLDRQPAPNPERVQLVASAGCVPSVTCTVFAEPSRVTVTATFWPGERPEIAVARSSPLEIFVSPTFVTTSPAFRPALPAGPSAATEPSFAPPVPSAMPTPR